MASRPKDFSRKYFFTLDHTCALLISTGVELLFWIYAYQPQDTYQEPNFLCRMVTLKIPLWFHDTHPYFTFEPLSDCEIYLETVSILKQVKMGKWQKFFEHDYIGHMGQFIKSQPMNAQIKTFHNRLAGPFGRIGGESIELTKEHYSSQNDFGSRLNEVLQWDKNVPRLQWKLVVTMDEEAQEAKTFFIDDVLNGMIKDGDEKCTHQYH